MPQSDRAFIVAVEDSLYPFIPRADLTHLPVNGRALKFVPACALSDPAAADLYVGDYVPSAPGRRFLMQVDSGAVYEVDEDGRVTVDGERLLKGDHRLSAWADAHSGNAGELVIGGEVALLLVTDAPDGVDIAIRRAGPVIIAGALPLPRHARRRVPRGWTRWVRERAA